MIYELSFYNGKLEIMEFKNKDNAFNYAKKLVSKGINVTIIQVDSAGEEKCKWLYNFGTKTWTKIYCK